MTSDPIDVSSVALSSPGAGSVVAELTVAVFISVPVASMAMLQGTVYVTELPAGNTRVSAMLSAAGSRVRTFQSQEKARGLEHPARLFYLGAQND